MTVSFVICKICGAAKRDLRNHVKTHSMSPSDYRSRFPNELMQCDETSARMQEALSAAHRHRPPMSEETKQKISMRSKEYHARCSGDENYINRQRQMAANARMAKGADFAHSEETKAKMRGPRLNTRGIPKSPEHRAKLAEARRKITGWSHSEETKAKMRETWKKRKEKPEYKAYIEGLSRRRVDYMVNNPQVFSETGIEIRMKSYLDTNGIDFSPQYPHGGFVYDFYIEQLNLLVEVDGEYWHCTENQLNRDRIKERKAKDSGFEFVRISDLNWKPEIVLACRDEQSRHNNAIMETRRMILAKKP